jgi:hypothetical protein
MQANDFVQFLLRSPLHGLMSGSVLVISFAGCRTGRRISTPVEYYEIGDELWVTSRRDRTWWRNLIGGADVRLQLRGRGLRGRAESLLDEDTVSAKLNYLCLRFPARARWLGIRTAEGRPIPEDIRRAAAERLLVVIRADDP